MIPLVNGAIILPAENIKVTCTIRNTFIPIVSNGDVLVWKDATAVWTQTIDWEINKKVLTKDGYRNASTWKIFTGDSVWADYKIALTKNKSNMFKVHGRITIENTFETGYVSVTGIRDYLTFTHRPNAQIDVDVLRENCWVDGQDDAAALVPLNAGTGFGLELWPGQTAYRDYWSGNLPGSKGKTGTNHVEVEFEHHPDICDISFVAFRCTGPSATSPHTVRMPQKAKRGPKATKAKNLRKAIYRHKRVLNRYAKHAKLCHVA